MHLIVLLLMMGNAHAADGDSYERFLELQAYLDSYSLDGASHYEPDEITTVHDNKEAITAGKDYAEDEPMIFFDYSDDEICTAVLSPVAIKEAAEAKVKVELKKVPAELAKPNKRISYL